MKVGFTASWAKLSAPGSPFARQSVVELDWWQQALALFCYSLVTCPPPQSYKHQDLQQAATRSRLAQVIQVSQNASHPADSRLPTGATCCDFLFNTPWDPGSVSASADGRAWIVVADRHAVRFPRVLVDRIACLIWHD